MFVYTHRLPVPCDDRRDDDYLFEETPVSVQGEVLVFAVNKPSSPRYFSSPACRR